MAIAVLVALPLCSAGQYQRDFYSSVSNLLDLVNHEREVRLMLLAYAGRLVTLHSNILNFVTTRQPYHDLETDSEVYDYMKHPVHAFHLMKRMIVDLASIESQIHELHASDPLPNITAMRANRLLPWEEDFNGIAVSLTRLQDTYLLDMANLVNGHLTITSGTRNRTVPGRIPLTARDCFFMGQVAVHNGYYDRSVEWVERAIDKVANEKPPSIPTEDLTKYLDLLIKKHDDVLDSMGKAVPVSERYKKPLQFQTKLFEEKLTSAQETQNYKRLCRGEQLRLFRSTHYGAQGMETSLIRTSSNAWLGDEDAPVATRLNRFVESLLGLGTHYFKGEAEYYQLANYGVGGQYIAHHDFLADILADPNRKGNAAFWWNLNADGEGEQLTKHGGCPVLYGSKWTRDYIFMGLVAVHNAFYDGSVEWVEGATDKAANDNRPSNSTEHFTKYIDLLIKKPAKIEEANLKPYVITFQDIIGDRDINDLLAFSTPRWFYDAVPLRCLTESSMSLASLPGRGGSGS
ncbi:hypothetical protein HPB49_022883 [Dermacentor silvarum]|uniref:Uncharacterized protein n=1 Tax=Dermacentor silvarum TaxID=543639 RepID=A0ACB8DR19_DERSI|nr:hypothetical protein HPB49_022883 [Dermacentor silvarum]